LNRLEEDEMMTYLLTWNPTQHFPWDDLEEYLAEATTGQGAAHSWSCGVTKSIAVGDRVFLMRLGDERRGIVASGKVEAPDPSRDGPTVRPGAAVYEDRHWEDPRRTALYVNVRFDNLLGRDHSLPVARLEELNDNLSEGKRQVWMPQNSGIRVIDEVADRLEAEWEGFLAANKTSGEDLNERGREYAIQVKRRGGGEGMAHLHLKKYVASNPHALGLHTSTFGIKEYLYVSGDECDVVFDLPDGNSAVVEVKDGRGAKGELVKGIYQAVKYRALMVAEKGQGANGFAPSPRTVCL
jgi:hypothetical protein